MDMPKTRASETAFTRDLLLRIKNDTVIGIMGYTQGVTNAPSPARIEIIKIPMRDLLSVSDIYLSLLSVSDILPDVSCSSDNDSYSSLILSVSVTADSLMPESFIFTDTALFPLTLKLNSSSFGGRHLWSSHDMNSI